MIVPLALLIPCLLAAGLAAAAWPAFGRMAMGAAAILSALGGASVLGWLIAAPGPETLGIGIGPPGIAMRLALDPLAGVFLLILFVSATACAASAVEPHAWNGRTAALLPVSVAAMALALLAADAFTLLAGLELMAAAAWAMIVAGDDAECCAAGLLYAGMAALAALCLIAAFALLSPADLGFAAMRAAPPGGWRALAVLALALIGAGSAAGLFPLHVWMPPAHAPAPAPAAALMSGAMTKVALYVVIRVLFDLCGPATPAWWGVPLLVLGAAGAVLGAARAANEADMKAALACGTVGHVGLIGVALGLALLARGSDLLPLAALALGAALLHAVNHGVFKTLMVLVAGAAQYGAGTKKPSRMGGLIHAMPITAGCALVGAAAMAAVPPSGGFAGIWMLLQAALAAPRIGGIVLQATLAAIIALIGLAIGLGALAAIRLVGTAFLGRPRTPRGAAAEEAGIWSRGAMLALAGVSVLLGLLPGAALRLLGPALRQMLGAGLDGPASALMLSAGADRPAYSALGVALLLAIVGGLLVLAVRRWAGPGTRRGPAWAGGFAAPPPWLPFGDPATQYGPASLSQPTLRALGPLVGGTERIGFREPGDPAAATYEATMRDPAETAVFAPAGRLRARASALAERMQALTARQTLIVMAACVVALLIAVAALEAA